MRNGVGVFAAWAVFVAAGCHDQSDLSVTYLGTTPLVAVGRIDVPVEVAVAGCAAVDAEVRGGDGGSRPVDLVPQADGTFQANVPVAWLREEDRSCLDDAEHLHASLARLTVACREDGRSASLELEVAYGTATRARRVDSGLPQATAQFLFPGADPLTPYALVPSAVEDWLAYLYPWITGVPLWIDGRAMLDSPLARPRLAAADGLAFYSAGCQSGATCQPVPSPAGPLPGVALRGLTIGPSRFAGNLNWWPVWVPGAILDLAFLPSGDLLVLSEVHDMAFWPLASAVTRVTPGPADPASPYTGTATVEVLAVFPRERVESRFAVAADGRLAFLSLAAPEADGPMRSALHLTDGQAVETVADPTGTLDVGDVGLGGSHLSYTSMALAPDASLVAAGGTSLGVPGGPLAPLPSTSTAGYWLDGDRGGVAWPDGGVALWRGASLTWSLPFSSDDGAVEAFDAAPPHGRRFGYEVHPLAGASAVALLHGAVAVGDKLVLTTSTGVRVLDAAGRLVGGADPLPCGLSPTSTAVRAGPTTAAVGAGPYLYVFDLAALP